MDCLNCDKFPWVERAFCAQCKTFVANPRAGKKAGVFKRGLANLVDYFPISLVTLLWAMDVARRLSQGEAYAFSSITIVGVGVVILLYWVFVFWLWSDGISPVKRVLGLEVVDRRDGNYVGFWKMAHRELGKLLSGLVFGLGFAWALWDKDGQTWHDKIAGTVVVQRHQHEFAPPLANQGRGYHCLKCKEMLRQQVQFCLKCKRPVKLALPHQQSIPATSLSAVDHLLELGIAHVRRGNVAAGQATLFRVIMQAPTNATAWLWMGWAAVGQGERLIAVICFSQARRLGHPKAAQILDTLRQWQAESSSLDVVSPPSR
jgi:uncharacterized RDD family membrane protein YckC